MAYPTNLQDLDATRGTTGQPLSNPNHITHHALEDQTIEALEAKVGIDGSAVTTSHDYKLSGVTASDKAASLTGTEDLTNKSLKTGTKITLGSDATGDIYYRHSDGTLKRLAVSTDGKILKLASGVPSWATETVTEDASTTVKGVVEEATLAQIDAGTAAGETGARLFVNPSTLGKSIDGTMADNSDAKIPSQKAVKTYVDGNPITQKNGATTYDLDTDSGTQTIAHGLGRTPKFVRLTFWRVGAGGVNWGTSTYNGTTQISGGIDNYNNTASSWISMAGAGGTIVLHTGTTGDATNLQTGTITFDGTNITITWVKANLPDGVYNIMWEAQ
jgi:hypothetical protein